MRFRRSVLALFALGLALPVTALATGSTTPAAGDLTHLVGATEAAAEPHRRDEDPEMLSITGRGWTLVSSPLCL